MTATAITIVTVTTIAANVSSRSAVNPELRLPGLAADFLVLDSAGCRSTQTHRSGPWFRGPHFDYRSSRADSHSGPIVPWQQLRQAQ